MPDSLSPSRPHAIVIGAGFGGLAAAVRLGARGWRVTLLEKLDRPGGRAYVHRQDGFTFDAGPTIITAPHMLRELWALAGRDFDHDITLRALNPFYEIRFDDGDVMRCGGDLALTRAEIARIAPQDLPGFERFLAESEKIYRIAFEQLAHQPFHSLRSFLAVAPELIRRQGYRSVHGMVRRYFSSEKLRIAFSFHPLFVGGDPRRTSAFYCLIAHLERLHGVHWAMGGTGRLIDGLAGLVEHQGGTIRANTQVAKILTENGRVRGVRLVSGETIAAEIVVSNADAAFTYGTLLDRPRRRWTDAKLARTKYSMSLFVWYFGTSRRYETAAHHTILMGPRYTPLLRDIFDRHHLAQDASLYLHRPTATDPSLAPPGCDSFYVLSPVPNLQGDTDWTRMAETYRARIEQRLHETLLPDLGRHIVTSRIATPLDFRDRLLSPHGAAFALQPRLLQSAWFRPHNKSEEATGLYLVGAGTHPGAGIPGVLSSARVLDSIVPHGDTIRSDVAAAI